MGRVVGGEAGVGMYCIVAELKTRKEGRQKSWYPVIITFQVQPRKFKSL